MRRSIKATFIGPAESGKTALATRLQSNPYSNEHPGFVDEYKPTFGADFVKRKIEDSDLYYEIWHTAGSERFRDITPVYTREAQIICVVYDATSTNSLEQAINILKQMNGLSNFSGHLLLVGNKSDLENAKVTQKAHQEQLEILQKTYPDAIVSGFNTSAKDEKILYASQGFYDFFQVTYPLLEIPRPNQPRNQQALLINSYKDSCNKYQNHLIKEISTELTQLDKSALTHPIFKDCKQEDPQTIKFLIESQVKVKFEDIKGPQGLLLGAIYKAQKLHEAQEALVGNQNNARNIDKFQTKIKDMTKDFMHHRLDDNRFKTFLRGLGVFGAALLGITFLGVGALVGGYYAHQYLFGDKGVTGTKFVNEIKDKSEKAEEQNIAKNKFK